MEGKKERSTKNVLLEHSRVKVELYTKYLSKYLNILKRAGFVEKIHLYDLMCGEGLYEDKSKGSPIMALETIKDHYFSNNKSCLDIEVWFNDIGKSDVEKGKTKIERVASECAKIYTPNNVNVTYTEKDCVKDLFPVIEKRISNSKNEKFLLFLDPYGYKDVTPEKLSKILSNKSVELLLFVPITPMYRFANKSLKEGEFKGGESLKGILKTLLAGEDKTFKNELDFINTLKSKYRSYLGNNFFVDTFTMQRDKVNTYALFFFTPHYKGFETMLKTKWELDENNGTGFKIDTNSGQASLFDEVIYSDYPELLKSFLKKDKRNNKDIFIFGLLNGYLPSHTNKVLKEWQKSNPNFKVKEDGKDARKGSFYIGSDYYSGKIKRLVEFELK